MKLGQSLRLLYQAQQAFKTNLPFYLFLYLFGSIALGFLEARAVYLVGPLLAAFNDQTAFHPKDTDGFLIVKDAFIRFLSVAAVATIWRTIMFWFSISLGSRLTSNVGNTLYGELTSQEYESFIQYDQPDLINRFAIDLERVRACYTTCLNLFSLSILGLFLSSELFFADARTTFLCLTIFVSLYFLIAVSISPYLIEGGRKVRAASRQQTNLLSNLFSTLYLLKNGRLRESYSSSYSSNENRIRKLYSQLQFFSSFPRLLVDGIGVLVLLLIIPLLNSEIGPRLLPLIGVYGAGFYKLLPTLQAIYSNWNEYAANESFLNSMHELIIKLNTNRQSLNSQESNIVISSTTDIANGSLVKPWIRFENVYFKYAGADIDAVSDINHSSFRGDRILITGPSGSGKSTYVDLLTGMLQPTSGCINVSDQLLGNLLHSSGSSARTRDLMTKVCEHVPAKPFIFNESLPYNITLQPDDQIDHNRLLECIEIVKLRSSFRRPDADKVYSGVKLNGENISNGERQKIGIARALYGNPKILVLDESLNSIDRTSSMQILADLSARSPALIIYLITHQPILDEWATQELSFENGSLTRNLFIRNP